MTEQELLASTDPQAMLNWLTGTGYHPGQWIGPAVKPSDRKLRLFACACTRQVRRHGEASLEAVTLAERAADGECVLPQSEWNVHHRQAIQAAEGMIRWVRGQHVAERCPDDATMTALLRDIIGNPLRPHIPLEHLQGSPWWLDPQVLTLAQVAYEERPGQKCEKCRGKGRFFRVANPSIKEPCSHCHSTGRIDDGSLDPFRLKLVADALEDVGCDEEELLRHLRGEEFREADGPGVPVGSNTSVWRTLRGPHVRGCWVLDTLLGKS